MFTGIITDIGRISHVVDRSDGLLRSFRIACAYDHATIALGASIACNGVCLTVTAKGRDDGQDWFDVDAAAETLRVTNAGGWSVGTPLNLERALRVGDELGGHIVSGHVDGIAQLVGREDLGDMVRFTLRAPADLSRFIAVKGSVALDGVSLTVNTVAGTDFSVLVIPHTLVRTILSDWRENGRIHLEIDTMARYAARLAETAAEV